MSLDALPPRARPTNAADLLNNRPIGQRAVVISAGVIANIIFAFGVLFAQVRRGTASPTQQPSPPAGTEH